MSPQIWIPPIKKSKMSRLKRKPGESLKEWVNRVTIKKPPFRLKDIDIIAIGIVVFCLVCIGVIELLS